MDDQVTIEFPAHTQNVALTRTVAATMAARAGLTVDRLEDVRLAVDEAVSQVIADAPGNSRVRCAFVLDASDLRVEVTAPTATGTLPSDSTFGWTVLRALVDDVVSEVHEGTLAVRLRVARSAAVGV